MQLLILDGSEDYCDKCGERVPPHNDIRELEAIRSNNGTYLLLKARHCLPVVRDGVTVCPGSPSRAQYLGGSPRDARGLYPYDPASEASYRCAWAELQQKAN